MRGPERLGFGPCLEHGSVFPHGVGGVERAILTFGTFEKVKLYKARHLVEMTVTRARTERGGMPYQLHVSQLAKKPCVWDGGVAGSYCQPIVLSISQFT